MRSRRKSERGRGRPLKFTDEMGQTICRLVAETERPISSICKELGISRMALYRWVDGEVGRDGKTPGLADFRDLYARAMQTRYQAVAADLLAVSDEDVIAGDRSDSARVQQQKLRVNTRQWLLSKQLPEQYGERLTVASNVEFDLPDLRPTAVVEAEEKAKASRQKDALPAGDDKAPERAKQ